MKNKIQENQIQISNLRTLRHDAEFLEIKMEMYNSEDDMDLKPNLEDLRTPKNPTKSPKKKVGRQRLKKATHAKVGSQKLV